MNDSNDIVQNWLHKIGQSEISVFPNVLAWHTNHEARFRNTYGGFISYVEFGVDRLVKLIHALNYVSKSDYPRQRALQLLLLVNNTGTLVSAFECLKSGSYVESLILSRANFEAIIRIMFCSYYPEDADSTLMQKAQEGKTRFNVTNFLQDHLKLDWIDEYRLLSSFGHSNIFSVLLDYGEIARDGQKKPLSFSLSIDSKKIEIAINFILFHLWNFCRFTRLFLLTNRKDKMDEQLVNEFIETEEMLGLILNGTPNIWPSRYKEAVKTYDMLVEKEREIVSKQKTS